VMRKDGLLIVSTTIPLSFRNWVATTFVESVPIKEVFIEPFYTSRLYQSFIRGLIGREARTSRDISGGELDDYLIKAGFKPIFHSLQKSRFLMVVATK
jgi:hypothetical protein